MTYGAASDCDQHSDHIAWGGLVLTRGRITAVVLALIGVSLAWAPSASAGPIGLRQATNARTIARAAGGMKAAQTALRLTDERLSLMKQVMASKWLSRSPIQDRAQERVVVAGALALSRRRGLADAGVRRFFEQQILAAKEVQLGWGKQWLWYGFPAHTTPPDLAQLRAKLSALTPKLVDALAGLRQLRCQPGVRADLKRASRRLIRTRFVSNTRRAGIVSALLSVRHVGSTCR
ncbi:MAG: hypothetical protein JO372_13355 [Solirubrobacterales bacterium]|nr:hypothetical protein [Solirubrobacterales bacterium]